LDQSDELEPLACL